MTPQRLRQLVDFLRRLGMEPEAAGGPGTDPGALAPVEEALTHTSSGRIPNHERLEFLGDAVLRLAAAEVLQQAHPELDVGRCSSLRAQLVSDRWLGELAGRCGLMEMLHLGPTAERDRAGRATVLAECCEALAGGIYEAWGGERGGLAGVRQWLEPHWREAIAELLADPHRHNWKSALQEWSQARGLGLPRYACRERSRIHGDPRRFHCLVTIVADTDPPGPPGETAGLPAVRGEGWGGSRREAEQQAARRALGALTPP
jgi:ribonuclease-3